MDYPLLIEERVSNKTFQEKAIPGDIIETIKAYHDNSCLRLIPDIKTELIITGSDVKEALEKAAGYNAPLVGSPSYMVLTSEDKQGAELNAGYIMEDLMLKARDLGYGSCWLTFTDSSKIKEALALKTDKKVVAVAAFGLAERARKWLHLNIITMSNIEISAKHHYFAPKKSIDELISIEKYGNKEGLDEKIGFYEDILWESFIAASKSPSYLNLQPYSFLLKGSTVYLLSEKEALTPDIDRDLNLGIAMLHFAAV
ncbi:MAG: nitroreductase family protein, partial [Spirochaetia bacterium]|nr:nitroreductase family protein [Spirochaetia bacterium]